MIEPDVARRDVKVANIDSENFEVGFSAGELSVEDFGVNSVTGLRFAYHISESFFLEGAGRPNDGWEDELRDPERLCGVAHRFAAGVSYYDVSFGYNILPGEGFIGKNRAWNTADVFDRRRGQDDVRRRRSFHRRTSAWEFGLMPLDWLAVHADVRDHIFDIDLLGTMKRTHNIELGVGLTFFF